MPHHLGLNICHQALHGLEWRRRMKTIILMKACYLLTTAFLESCFPPGCEGAQMWDLWAGVHSVGQHEETRADPYQHSRLPVSPLLQEFCAETDPQSTHDRPLWREAFQMQGEQWAPWRDVDARTQRVVLTPYGGQSPGNFPLCFISGVSKAQSRSLANLRPICCSVPLCTTCAHTSPLLVPEKPALFVPLWNQSVQGRRQPVGEVWGWKAHLGNEVVKGWRWCGEFPFQKGTIGYSLLLLTSQWVE